MRVRQFMQHAPIIKTTDTLADLEAVAGRKGTVLPELLRQCDDELSQLPVSPYSRIYKDANGVTLAAYFGYRHTDVSRGDDLTVDNQYVGLSESDMEAAKLAGRPTVFDGLTANILADYQKTVQELASTMQPTLADRDIRHTYNREDLSSYLHTYVDDKTGEKVEERVGVHHLLHCWTMQGHPDGPLMPSKDIRGHTAAQGTAVNHFYYASQPVAHMLAEMFKATFPAEYERYREAFEAGKWLAMDPGPWIGRAIVYKLDVQLHWDGLDGGPTASFGCGQYRGGVLELPQLKARLQYGPGAVLLSRSGILAHRVLDWVAFPPHEDPATGCTAGRIGSVFFFPENTLRLLKGKPVLWGQKTNYGKREKRKRRNSDEGDRESGPSHST